jgi:hypothetical protein
MGSIWANPATYLLVMMIILMLMMHIHADWMRAAFSSAVPPVSSGIEGEMICILIYDDDHR